MRGKGVKSERKRLGRKEKMTEEERRLNAAEETEKRLAEWIPKTTAGKMVKNGEIESLDQFFERNLNVMEPEIVDMLLPDLEEKLVDFHKTAKVRRSGRQFSFRATVLVGDKNSYIGVGTGKDRERFPATRKAARNAKLNLVKVRKGCGSWQCGCQETHSIPFKVSGKSSSVRVVLLPAPKGTELVVGNNIKDVMILSGIKDVWSKSSGNTGSKLDFVAATIDALRNTTKKRLSEDIVKQATRK
ncbi:MAG: 30S ribosomal protein S5, small subunit ribosomal protein S5 [archaeon GW2011_AR10]|nr:MAG: 30S ribosomal protein S5, small subunit ribosomal protein S5 [archaeon GW2011_AR10]